MISARRAGFVGVIALVVGALAAFAVASSAERDDTFEAVATVAVGRLVPTEELDAERDAMIARVGRDRIDAVVAGAGATEVDLILPDDRSNIVVVTRAASEQPAADAAARVLEAFEMVEADLAAAPHDQVRAELEAGVGPLVAERDRLQAEIDALPADEARLTVPLSGFLEDDERAELETELAAVQQALSALRSERDEIVDDLNALENDLRRAEVRRVTTAEPLVVVAPEVRDTADDLLRSALVTFLLAGAAALAAGLVLSSPRRIA